MGEFKNNDIGRCIVLECTAYTSAQEYDLRMSRLTKDPMALYGV